MRGKAKFRAAPPPTAAAALPILAAGGIVVRRDLSVTARFAVVQSARKRDARGLHAWGLPKGKLAPGEAAVAAARREVIEETGHHVTVHDFLGTLVYQTGARPKAVQFWCMEASGPPGRVPMPDVRAVDWLTLEDALKRLSHVRERVFLEQAGPVALRLCRDLPALADPAGRRPLPEEDATPSAPPADPATAPLAHGKTRPRKTWRWFGDTALPQRQRADWFSWSRGFLHQISDIMTGRG